MSKGATYRKGDLVVWHDDFYHKDDPGDVCRVLFGNEGARDLVYIDPKDLRIGPRWVKPDDLQPSPVK